MASSCITFPARKGLSSDINGLAIEWGSKQHGNGGYTGFISDIIEAIVENTYKEDKTLIWHYYSIINEKITANS